MIQNIFVGVLTIAVCAGLVLAWRRRALIDRQIAEARQHVMTRPVDQQEVPDSPSDQLHRLLEDLRAQSDELLESRPTALPERGEPTLDNGRATRASWNIRPCPEARASLAFNESYTAAEFEKIKAGCIPEAMEDKWFIFFEEPWLYMHRSWTGSCTFGVRLESSTSGVTARDAWVSRDATQYNSAGTDYDEVLLKFLIDALLLDRHVTFPLPNGFADSRGIYRHSMVGRAYPEGRHVARAQSPQSFWKRLWGRLGA